MPLKDNAKPNDYQPYPEGDFGGTINAPDLSRAGKPRVRAIKDIKQAKAIITTLEVNNRERNIKNARIMAKYNAERPHSVQALKQDGLDWKSNFTTKPLPMLIDKVSPRFVTAIQGMKYLTNAALPDSVPGAAVKTENFRREVTKTIRNRAGWANLLAEFSQENALFGYTGLAWLDEFHWMPKHFRQDEFFIPTGTKQHSKSAQVVALKETFLIHELFELIEDRKAAETAGWNLENTTLEINESMPLDRRSSYGNWERVYEDLIRESNVGLSHEAGARVVVVWHLLATEIEGKVSHYILNEKCGKELFSREDQFDGMADAISFFSFQQGNGTMHGSKGIGREIYSMAAMLDRARNEVVDRLNLSGKLVIQCDEKAIRKFRMSVVGNTILISKGYEVLDRKIDGDVEPFLQMDQFLTALLDQMAGATTPRVFEGERVTKAQVDFFAAREEESKDNIIGRFLNQFADMMTTIQKRICDSNTSEEDAKELQKKLLTVMTREELNQISGQRVAETVRDYTELERQQIILVAQEARGNPLYNQKELERRKLIAQTDEDFANAVLLPDEDPTETAEQTRLQMLELDLITRLGAEVPVSPRDNHLIHLGLVVQAMNQAAAAAAKDPNGIDSLVAMLAHGEAHFQFAEQLGYPKEQLAEVKQVLTQTRSVIPQLLALSEQQKAAEAQAAGVPPEPGAVAPPEPAPPAI